MEQEDLKSVLESLLFVSNRPLAIGDFAKALEGVEPDTIKTALDEMAQAKKTQGIVLLESSGQYQLGTNSKYSTAVKNFLNAELREKLTDATVEVLAIVAYRQPISKAEIEAIRGVNSQYSVRNLLMRGLIEKIPNPRDARSFLYQTTTEFLQHLGLTSAKDLPEFDKLVQQIKLPETPPLQQESQAAQTPATEPQITAQAPENNPQPEALPAPAVTEELPAPAAVNAENNTPIPSEQPIASANDTGQEDDAGVGEKVEDDDEEDEEDEDDEENM